MQYGNIFAICVLFSLGSDTYDNKTKQYRRNIVEHLHRFAMDFIEHIKLAVLSFPASLHWLISHVNKILIHSQRYDDMQSTLCMSIYLSIFGV